MEIQVTLKIQIYIHNYIELNLELINSIIININPDTTQSVFSGICLTRYNKDRFTGKLVGYSCISIGKLNNINFGFPVKVNL